MMDKISPARRSNNMRHIRSFNTKPEITVRQILFSLGYRYRLHRKDLPGKPDLVFAKRKKIIFIHGCFWHQHNLTTCLDSRIPKSNKHYWNQKLKNNVQRDIRNQMTLKELGWDILIIWECEIKNDKKLIKRIQKFLNK
jgi:DNA mismatch endonuclease (patch repair protein)